ncbi:MAG: hypothetical protein CEE43_17330 [Promethearchaeota archaeon Loki_b32]|nr:MAG: hypothetical protein CEE43_17330 [Candidatus Lokiarchaeota archaeon Loki_b32]
MPGGDRTGPRGLGSMTGRGLGYCAGYDAPGYTIGPGMGLGRGWGRGWGVGYGRGFGYGRGVGYGRGLGYRGPNYAPVYTPYPSGIIPQITPENQLTMLKQEKEYLESEMNGIKSAVDDISKRIEELEKKE